MIVLYELYELYSRSTILVFAVCLVRRDGSKTACLDRLWKVLKAI